MDASPQALALIAAFEGFAATPYRCPAGILTIGYGHAVRPGEDYSHGISEAQAMALLATDAAAAAQAVVRLIDVPLRDQQRDALVSFTFNLGAGALQRATFRRAIRRGEHEAVPAQLMRWVYAGGRVLPGLVRRRQAEGWLYAHGYWR